MGKISVAQLNRGKSKDIKSKSTDPYSNIKLEKILTYFVDEKGICKECGQNHSNNPNYEYVRTSIDIIADLF
jgi:hypothetical protein